MIVRLLAALVVALALASSGCSGDDNDDSNDGLGAPQICAQAPNGNLCSFIPHDITEPLNAGYSQLGAVEQRPFDEFSWQSFVALNWPATADGTPIDSRFSSNPDAPRVWQSYATSFEVFDITTADGKTKLPAACVAVGKNLPIVQLVAKNDHIKPEPGSFLEATGQPLVDRNGNFVLYDIRVNPVEEAYLESTGLNTLGGQVEYKASGQDVSFPLGFYTDVVAKTGGSVGAMEIKTAWRILDATKGDDPSRFFVQPSLVFVPAGNTESGEDLCFEAELGLVGMHIIQRTTGPVNFDQDWMWSTFEHVDNAPVATNAADRTSTAEGPTDCTPPRGAGEYSFFNPRCTQADCAPNTAPTLGTGEVNYLWASDPPYARRYLTSGGYGTQVVDCWETFPETAELNRVFQAKLAGTVFANYRLVNTQWQGGIEDPVTENGNIPRYLSNTTLETYIQNDASCLDCHRQATTAVGQDANFSFLLGLPQLQAEPAH